MNSSLVQQLSYIVPAISISFLFVITSINVYFKIRRNFPATVNCWFCNVNAKVPYADSNSWTCPACEQYNGFTADGDYNCVIESQRCSKLNKTPNAGVRSLNGSIDDVSRMPTNATSNGLCQPCNRNQELKMQQLASFEPENETYFDEEVTDFRHKLEQVYRLCPRCERHLKRTLNNVKKNILGSKLAQLGANGLRVFDLHFSTAKSNEKIQQRRQLFAKICLLAMIVISTLTAYQTTAAVDINKTKLDAVFNPSTTAAMLMVASYISACKILVTKFINYFVSLPYIAAAFAVWRLTIAYIYAGIGRTVWSSIFNELNQLSDGINGADNDENIIANVAGCLMSIFVIFTTGFRFSSAFSLILWTANILLATRSDYKGTLVLAMTIDAISILLIWASTILSFWNFRRLTTSTNNGETESKNSSFHRIYSECGSDVSDESDAESELNTSLQSNRSFRTIRSERPLLQSSNSTLNTSFVSQAPSMFSTSTYAVKRPHRTSMNNLLQANCFASDSIRASHMDSSRDLYDEQSVHSSLVGSTFNQFGNRPESLTSVAGSENQFYAGDVATFADRCSSRFSLNDSPDEFQSGITQLSISGVAKNRKSYRNISGNQTSESTAPLKFRQRKTLLLPARLSYHESNQQDDSMSAIQSSWLAGGYWNNTTSPKKKQQNLSSHWYKANDIFPIISRTSSQSSGFESMKNCVDSIPFLQQPYDDNNIDRMPALSNRSLITHSRTNCSVKNTNSFGADNSYAKIEHNNLLKNQLHYPVIDKYQSIQRSNLGGKSVSKANTFDTATLQQHLPFSNYRNGAKFAKYSNNCDVVTFQKGSLLNIKGTQCSGSTTSSATDMPFNNCCDSYKE